MNQVQITIPSMKNDGTRIGIDTRADMVNRAQYSLSALFGGATAIDGQGVWQDDDGDLVKEVVTVVSSWAETMNDEIARELKHLACDLARAGSQDCILLTIERTDAKVWFVTDEHDDETIASYR